MQFFCTKKLVFLSFFYFFPYFSAQATSITISKELVAQMNDHDLLEYLHNLGDQNVTITMHNAQDLDLLESRINQYSIAHQEKEHLRKLIKPIENNPSKSQSSPPLKTLIDASDTTPFENNEISQEHEYENDEAYQYTSHEPMDNYESHDSMNNHEAFHEDMTPSEDTFPAEQESSSNHHEAEANHESLSHDLPSDAPLQQQKELSETVPHPLEEDNLLHATEPSDQATKNLENAQSSEVLTQELAPEPLELATKSPQAFETTSSSELSKEPEHMQEITSEHAQQTQNLPLTAQPASPALEHGATNNPRPEPAQPKAQPVKSSLTIPPVPHKQQTFTHAEQKEIVTQLLHSTQKMLQSNPNVGADKDFTQKLITAFNGALPENMVDGITSLYATPETVYTKLAEIMGSSQAIDAFMSINDFYKVVEPYGLIMMLLRDFNHNVTQDKSAQNYLEKLINSLMSLETGIIDPEKVYLPSVKQEAKLIQSGAYKGLLKDSIIMPLAKDYAIAEFLYGISNLIARAQTGQEKSLEFVESLFATKKNLTTLLLDTLIHQLKELNRGTETYLIDGLPVTQSSVQEKKRNQAIYKLLQRVFDPLLTILDPQGTPITLEAYGRASFEEPIQSCLELLEKKITDNVSTIPWLDGESPASQKAFIEHVIRTFLIDVIKKRLMHLQKAIKTL